jgi:hypothetical protein
MPHGRDALAAVHESLVRENADAPLIPIYLKPWGVRRRTYRATVSRGRTVFFVGATRSEHQPLVLA